MSSPHILDLLTNYKPFDSIEEAHVRQLRQFLEDSHNPYDRSNLTAHTVADAWVTNPERTHVLLLVHAERQVWLTPGGHTDGNSDILSEALRELQEETGIQTAKSIPECPLFDINVGVIPTCTKHGKIEPTHLHFDICFAFEVSMDIPLHISSESSSLVWQPIENLHNLVMPCHKRRADKMLAHVLG